MPQDAHNVFTYTSWQSIDNSEVYQAQYVGMQVVCGFFDGNARAALKEYQCWSPSQRKPNRHVCNSTLHSFHQQMFAVTNNLQSEEGVLDDGHEKPLPNTVRLHMTWALLRMQFGTNCMRSNCVCFLYNLQKSYSQGTVIFTSNSLDCLYRNCN